MTYSLSVMLFDEVDRRSNQLFAQQNIPVIYLSDAILVSLYYLPVPQNRERFAASRFLNLSAQVEVNASSSVKSLPCFLCTTL